VSLLNIKDLKLEVLKNMNFKVEKSEIFGIAGESGSGKTTLGLSILRLLSKNAFIDSGKIIFDDKDLLKIKPSQMVNIRGAGISMIFQDPLNALNPVFTAGFQLKESIKTHQRIASKYKLYEKAITSLEDVRLKNPKNVFSSFPHQLSGGMRQRVMIAQAISSNPSILIADEPTSNLDVTTQKEILDLFKELKEKFNLSILLISHDLDLIKYICDKVAILNKGVIEEIGLVQDVLLNPQAEYTKELIESYNFINL